LSTTGMPVAWVMGGVRLVTGLSSTETL
jgi:hypothetical protein